MKILGLDIGDAWVGSAISDAAGITCRPYKTVHVDDLTAFLEETLKSEQISTVVVGHPITLKGGKSQQTEVVEKFFEDLKKKFSDDLPNIGWVLWDERFSSQRAVSVMKQGGGSKKKKRDKERREHSFAAAIILQSYLDSKAVGR